MVARVNNPTAIQAMDVGESIQRVISDAEFEKDALEQRILEDKGRIEALDFIISNARRSLTAHRRGVMPIGAGKWDSLTRRDLSNMSIREILIYLARENEGIVKGLDAVRVLMRTGIVSERRSADAQVYTVLNREKETFHKIEPGVYKLVTDSYPDDLPF